MPKKQEYQGETAKAAADVDPTVRSRGDVPEYPEGTHPPAPIEAQTWSGGRLEYGEMDDKDKPDPSSVVNTVEADPIQEETQEVLREDAKAGAEQTAKEAEQRAKAQEQQ